MIAGAKRREAAVKAAEEKTAAKAAEDELNEIFATMVA